MTHFIVDENTSFRLSKCSAAAVIQPDPNREGEWRVRFSIEKDLAVVAWYDTEQEARDLYARYLEAE